MNVSARPATFALVLASTFTLAALGRPSPAPDAIPTGWEASNMQPLGYTALGGRGGAEKLAIKQVNGRWYLYAGQLWDPGLSIVDVTDPTNPTLLKYIPGAANTWDFNLDLHDNLLITALQRPGPGWGLDPDQSREEGVRIWDISDPVGPRLLSHWRTGSTGTHRNGYPGGRYANLAANMPGYRGQILVFLDVSDPKNPKEAGRWWMPGQKETEPPAPQPISFHGPAIIDGDKAYLGYGPAIVILDISDIAHPTVIGELRVRPPFGQLPVHDVQLIKHRNLLYANGEATAGDSPPGSVACETGPLTLSGLIDIKDPSRPTLISLFPTPVPPTGAPYASFCDKGGRFGPHNANILSHSPDVEQPGDLIYVTYFNAGVRIFDIRNPRLPKEVGWFVPPTPVKRYGPKPDQLVTQTEDVLVDTRGNIYITDKQWGIFVLRYTGAGR